MRDLVGQQFGDYCLVRLLGSGGFAEVYLGQHVRHNAQAAVKILHARLAGKEVKSFQQEAQIIAGLVHPNIVRILDYETKDDVPFLVMDYAPHGSLREQHPKGTHLSLSTVVSYIQQVASALQYAHNKRIIHRDVKPENMLLGRNGEILLSDFGIASIAHSTASMSLQAPRGTVYYMAPEQINKRPRPASDQYALGVVVYEWLCGAYPFEGKTPVQILLQHVTKPPPPLREKVPGISPHVEQVVLKALEKDPKQRFADVLAFAQALEVASQVGPGPSGPLPKLTGSRRISRRAAIGCLSMTVAGVAVGGLGWWLNVPHPAYTYRGHSDVVNTVGWSLDGKRVASGSDDKTVQVWNAGDGGNVLTYRGHNGPVRALGWSPDRIHIASGSDDKTVQVWNAGDGKLVYTYPGHTSQVKAVAWSPDGTRIASGDDSGAIQVWHALDGGNVFAYTSGGILLSRPIVTWSPDGSRIAVESGIDGNVQVLDAATGGNIYTHQGQGMFEGGALAWSPDGKYIAIAATEAVNGTVEIINAATGERVFIYQGQHTVFTQWSPSAVVWAPDSKRIAAGIENGATEIWDALSGGNVHSYNSNDQAVNAVACSPDGVYIASGCNDGVVQVWRTM